MLFCEGKTEASVEMKAISALKVGGRAKVARCPADEEYIMTGCGYEDWFNIHILMYNHRWWFLDCT